MSHPRKPKQKPPTLYDGVWWGKLQDGLYMKAEEAVGKTFDNRKLLRSARTQERGQPESDSLS